MSQLAATKKLRLIALPIYTGLSFLLVGLIWQKQPPAFLSASWILYVGIAVVLLSGVLAASDKFGGVVEADVTHANSGLSHRLMSRIARLGVLLRKFDYTHRYDLFLSGTLLVWLAYWQTDYTFEAPIYLYYPAYFVGIGLLLPNLVARNSVYFPADQMKLMKLLHGSPVLHPDLLVGLILYSLADMSHYLLYPILCSLLLIRFSFNLCLHPYTE